MWIVSLWLVLTLRQARLECSDSVLDGTELLMTFLVHRHGDRTPLINTTDLSTDPAALRALTAPIGYGQLTNVGKNCSYLLGQFIRKRYNGLLSSRYDYSEIYIRSTDSSRTKMTVLTAMAAVYPALENNWSARINWTPTPYTTMPMKYDFMLPVLNCPNYIVRYNSASQSSPAVMKPYSHILDLWSQYSGIDVNKYPMKSYIISDIYTTQITMGLPVTPEIESILPEIRKLADIAIDCLFGNDSNFAHQAGPLLNNFLTLASQVVAGGAVPKVQIYSAHDMNVYFLQAISRVTPRQGAPKYGSAFALELRRIVDTGAYVVLPVYLPSPGSEVKYLQVDGCDDVLCDLDRFRSITSDFVYDENTWRTACGFTDDLDINNPDEA